MILLVEWLSIYVKTRLQIADTPDGLRLVISRLVDANPDRIWELFVDTRQWPEWGPSITAVESSERHIRNGTTGRVRIVGGLWLPFTVTSMSKYRWTWRVAGVRATGHYVEPLDGRCRVAFEVPILVAPYLLVCRQALLRIDILASGPNSTRSQPSG